VGWSVLMGPTWICTASASWGDFVGLVLGEEGWHLGGQIFGLGGKTGQEVLCVWSLLGSWCEFGLGMMVTSV